MPEISATVRMRPTRIGFLVRPSDTDSIRKIMRCNACIWGGIYNPIVPVYQKAPKHWKSELPERVKGYDVAKGYVRFFEPDVFVESETGLVEAIGLADVRQKHTLHPRIVKLDEFLKPRDDRDWAEPGFGLSITDVLRHIYNTEQQFVRREKREYVLVKPEKNNALTEAVFGAYPTQRHSAYIGKAYADVFKPTEMDATPAAWLKVFKKSATIPLQVTQFGIETQRFWHHEPIVQVFDPNSSTDLIDLWNIRLEPRPVIPLPVDWFETVAKDISQFLKAEHRPIRGNPQGLMHHATINFGSSISKERMTSALAALDTALPREAASATQHRNSIWIEHRNNHSHRDGRMTVTAKERRIKLVTTDEGRGLYATYENLSPEFASRHGGHDHRWVNALEVSTYGHQSVATVLPFNTFRPDWPRLGMGGEHVLVGTEGWVFFERYRNMSQYVSLLTHEQAIVGSLKQYGIDARPSEPGHIAKQMLEHLGGLRGVHLLADVPTLQLLNKMAGGVRRKSNETETVEETFELRSAPIHHWQTLISQRREKRELPGVKLADFTNKNVIRLGLETVCPNCNYKNWASLSAADYQLTCDRCLKT